MSATTPLGAEGTWRRPQLDLPPAPGPADWDSYLSVHAKSFWAASRLMHGARRAQLAGVYAYCRYTDDLVDKGGRTPDELLLLLDRWELLSRAAYDGQTTGVALLDSVMYEMARNDVPFAYALALLRGMRLDAIGARFASMAELRGYCYSVASVVGLWLTELFGVHDAWTLERAAELGIAMQLTNIARDVGEDWTRGRLYLPRDLMNAHGITPSMIDRWVRERSGSVTVAYAALIEELMETAEVAYARAAEAIPNLPDFFQPAVAAASRLYAAIHDEIRANAYDNLTRRAVVPTTRRLSLARDLLAASATPPTQSPR